MKAVTEASFDGPGALFGTIEPLVMREVVPAASRQRFEAEALSMRMPSRIVQVARTQGGVFKADRERGHYHAEQMRRVPLDRALSELSRQRTPETYIPRLSFDDYPDLVSCLPFENPGRREQRLLAGLWIGPAKNRMTLHHDFADNLFVQLIGHKRFVLLPPYHELAEYRLPIRRFGQRSSWHGTTVDDVERTFGGRDDATLASDLREVTLGPGDVLWLPNLWWHQVDSLHTPTISASSWWSATTMESIQARILGVTREGERLGRLPDDWRERVGGAGLIGAHR